MVVVDEEAGKGFAQETFELLTTNRTGRKEAPERDTSCTISGLARIYFYSDSIFSLFIYFLAYFGALNTFNFTLSY